MWASSPRARIKFVGVYLEPKFIAGRRKAVRFAANLIEGRTVRLIAAIVRDDRLIIPKGKGPSAGRGPGLFYQRRKNLFNSPFHFSQTRHARKAGV
jgi:hypothetical protein